MLHIADSFLKAILSQPPTLSESSWMDISCWRASICRDARGCFSRGSSICRARSIPFSFNAN